MAFDSLDGASTGSQDRALSTTAIFFPTATTTSLSASSTSVEQSVFDTATVTGAAPSAAGSVAFAVYSENTCTTAATTGVGGQINAQPTQATFTNSSGTITATSSNVTFQQAGTYYWQATYSGDSTNHTIGSKSACLSEPVTVASPHLTITKTADAASVNAGSSIGFTITLSNAGPGDSTGTTLTDPLPSGTGISWSIASQSGPATCSILAGPPQTLDCGSFTLASGASEVVHVTSGTTAGSCGTYNNTASFTSGNDGSGSASASETVNCPTLTITKTADSASVNAGSAIGFTITLSNAGPGASTGTTLTDPLPGGTGISWSIASQSGPPTCSILAGPPQTLDCGSFTLASGAIDFYCFGGRRELRSFPTRRSSDLFTSGNDGSGS